MRFKLGQGKIKCCVMSLVWQNIHDEVGLTLYFMLKSTSSFVICVVFLGGPSCDPGWNDPPMFSYGSQIAQMKSSKPRTFLNKRVAFPLNEGTPPTSNRVAVDPTAPLPLCNISSLPPPPISFPVQIKEASGVNRVSDELDYNGEKTLQDVMSNFNNVLIKKFEKEEKASIWSFLQLHYRTMFMSMKGL